MKGNRRAVPVKGPKKGPGEGAKMGKGFKYASGEKGRVPPYGADKTKKRGHN